MAVAMENPGLIVADIKLTIEQLSQLTEMVTGESQSRPSDKKTAFIRLGKKLSKIVGIKEATETMTFLAFKTPDMNTGQKRIEEVMKKIQQKKESKKQNRVNRAFDLDAKIRPTVKENPRKKPTGHGFKAFDYILSKPGLTVREYLDNGGRAIDLKWDLAKGWVELK